MLAGELTQLGWHTVAGATFVSNFLLWSEVGYFDVVAESKPLLHLWSLGIEEQFYIVWPLLIWSAWRWKRLLPVFFLISILGSFSLSVYLTSSNPTAAFYSPVSRFWELLCGALLAWHIQTGSAGRSKLRSEFSSASGLLIIAFCLWHLDRDSLFPGYWALLPTLAAILVISAGPSATLNRFVLSNRVAVWFGLISFPLYLWHWPIFSFGRIVYDGHLPRNFEPLALLLAVLLAWMTTRFAERPFRFSGTALREKSAALVVILAAIGIGGFAVGKIDFRQSHAVGNLTIARKESYAIGTSSEWFRGKSDWLFLGNVHNRTVAKMTLGIVPDKDEIEKLASPFSELVEVASRSNTKVVLLVGPDKSSVYPEYLPSGLSPSRLRYVDFFLDRLKSVPNLTVHDPTLDLVSLKSQEELLYWRTDTHWNQKGGFLALRGALTALGLPAPAVTFRLNGTHSGDLIAISKESEFPLHSGDNWEAVWPKPPEWKVTSESGQSLTFGAVEVVENPAATIDMTVWVVGDSFTSSLRPYFNAAFKTVNYVGHWSEKLDSLPEELANAKEKPDVIFVVKVERTF